jgi:hypothetical protein
VTQIRTAHGVVDVGNEQGMEEFLHSEVGFETKEDESRADEPK